MDYFDTNTELVKLVELIEEEQSEFEEPDYDLNKLLEARPELAEKYKHIKYWLQQDEDNILQLAGIIKNHKNDIEQIDRVIEHLQKQKKQKQKSIDNYKTLIDAVFEVRGLTKLKNAIHSIYLQSRSNWNIEVVDIAKVPYNFVKIEMSVKKADIQKLLKDNEKQTANINDIAELRIPGIEASKTHKVSVVIK